MENLSDKSSFSSFNRNGDEYFNLCDSNLGLYTAFDIRKSDAVFSAGFIVRRNPAVYLTYYRLYHQTTWKR